MQIGSQNFSSYERNLRRLHWLSFIDAQLRERRHDEFRASLVTLCCERPVQASSANASGKVDV